MNISIETYIVILFALGSLCLLLGLLLHFKDDEGSAYSKPAFTQPYESEKLGSTNVHPKTQTEQHYHNESIKGDDLSHMITDAASLNRPSDFHRFDQDKQEIDIKSSHSHLKFLKRNVYLYFDHDNNNVYTGEENTSEITEIGHIKRVGLGALAYDGISFKFTHDDRVQLFKISQLDYIALYPNCLVIVSRKKFPTALFFMDETEKIHRILNLFKS